MHQGSQKVNNERSETMDDAELMKGLKEARDLLERKVSVIDAWVSIKALHEIIKRLDRKEARI